MNFLLQLFSQPACTLDQSKFGIPTWYKYIEGQEDPLTGKCQLPLDFDVSRLGDQLLRFSAVGLAAIEILLFISGLVAVGFIIYGGFRYLTSQGEPDQTAAAKNTILNALIGMVIAIIATTFVRFIAGRLTNV